MTAPAPSAASRERPIIFTPGNVRRVIDGAKWATRRIVKGVGSTWTLVTIAGDSLTATFEDPQTGALVEVRNRYGGIGDTLWVKEPWLRPYATMGEGKTGAAAGYIYRADGPEYLTPARRVHSTGADETWRHKWFMPKEAARLRLTITDLDLARVTSMTERDAIAEGATSLTEFRAGWDEINPSCPFDSSPWCWVITFKERKCETS